jgi:hypothetical protein
MNRLLLRGAVVLATLLPMTLLAENDRPADTGTDVYVQLVDATNFMGSYAETARVSAEVFATRGQGSDAKVAKVMASVGRLGISDIKGCVAKAFSNPPMTPQDAADLVETFKSPVGKRFSTSRRQW